MAGKKPLTFAISLSVLNHLGRNLYRSFATVMGEAVSNSWDADARTVRIDVDRDKGSLVIADDGDGMSADDIQNKFLHIGYSKRKMGRHKTRRGRPYIGRKGIGKLALLSCAQRITVVSKTRTGRLAGGVIDNRELDKAITDDLQPQDYVLGEFDSKPLEKYTRGLRNGTVIRFDSINDGVRNSIEHLRKIIALYFRFSLVDRSFKIYLNGEQVSFKDLKQLAEHTEFLWKIGDVKDPFVADLEKLFRAAAGDHEIGKFPFSGIRGFVGSVEKPTNLKIMATDERVGIDLFVNGRLRERDILKHIPTAQVSESYLYGQIHFDGLNDQEDRFTSSREGIVANDPKYEHFLKAFRKILLKITNDWDRWRRKHRKEGDSDNPAVSKKQRASDNLYNEIINEFGSKKGTKKAAQVDEWFEELSTDASYNFQSYGECFVSENLIRKFIKKRGVALSVEAKEEIIKWKGVEVTSKNKGNISIDIRKGGDDLSYLGMGSLANLVDKKDPNKEACLVRDANEFKPMRDAVAHTALLTDQAKKRLSTVRENIKARVHTLLQ
jgi:hypothetical protein